LVSRKCWRIVCEARPPVKASRNNSFLHSSPDTPLNYNFCLKVSSACMNFCNDSRRAWQNSISRFHLRLFLPWNCFTIRRAIPYNFVDITTDTCNECPQLLRFILPLRRSNTFAYFEKIRENLQTVLKNFAALRKFGLHPTLPVEVAHS